MVGKMLAAFFLVLSLTLLNAHDSIPTEDPVLEDEFPPSISTSVSVSGNTYTISVSASDPSGVRLIEIYVKKPTQSQYTLVKTCQYSTSCSYTNTDTEGTYFFYAKAVDGSSLANQATSQEKSFTLGDSSPPTTSVSASVNGNIATITAAASDPSGISSIKIYVAQGSPAGHGPFSEVKSCSSSPCQYVSGFNSGTYIAYASATDNSSNIGNSSLITFTVVSLQGTEPLSILTGSLPKGQIGKSYIAELEGSGGERPYTWRIISGSLPPGLQLSSGAEKGLISGTPTKAGTYSFIVQIQDIRGQTSAGRGLSITIEGDFSRTCKITPSSLNLVAGSTQRLSIICYRTSATGITDEDECPPVSWGSTIGSISGNSRGATFSAGQAAGSGRIVASGNDFSCSIPVSVYLSSSGGGGGGGGTGGGGGSSGGGTFRTAITVSATCIGKPVEIFVRYISNATAQPKATVDVYHYSEAQKRYNKVYTNTISSSSFMSFTPTLAGKYEVRVSLGTDQTTANFVLQECSPEIPERPINLTLQLSPSKEIILNKRVTYSNGFSKDFRVYRITDGTTISYESQVEVAFVPNSTKNLTVRDSVPNSIVSNMQQITFDVAPRKVDSGQPGMLAFEWQVQAEAGKAIRFRYSFSRQLTDQMIESIAAPTLIIPASQTQEVGLSLEGVFNTASAALVGTLGSGWWVIAGLLGLLLLAVIYLFLFGSKKEG
ncbi:MAG: putative Ig domain-containing protein [Candidatus Anstonellaceae archaeon]